MDKVNKKDSDIEKQDAARSLLLNLELKPTKDFRPAKFKNNAVKGYKPGDNRQVTHNLRRRMGR